MTAKDSHSRLMAQCEGYLEDLRKLRKLVYDGEMSCEPLKSLQARRTRAKIALRHLDELDELIASLAVLRKAHFGKA